MRLRQDICGRAAQKGALSFGVNDRRQKIKEQRKNSAVAAAAAKKTISYAIKFAKKFAPAGIKRLSPGKNQSKIGGQQRKK